MGHDVIKTDASPPTRFRSFGASDVGRRRSDNQDRWATSDTTLLVCDGIGGRPGGAEAAQIAVTTFMETVSEKSPDAYLLDYAATRADHEVRLEGERGELAGMGSTLAGAVLGPDGVLWTIGLGDSRVYRLRVDQPLQQLSIDHTLAEEANRNGAPPISSKYASVITRAIGAGSAMANPEVFRHDALIGDRLLVCSDGLTNEVPDDEIGGILGAKVDPEEIVSGLMARALTGGGRDNITIVVADAF